MTNIKGIFGFILVAIISTQAIAQSVTITEATGWFESAAIQWQCTENAIGFNVTYSGQDVNDQLIDTQLIRNYGDYYRADIPGLKAGTYTLTVVPIMDGQEGQPVDSNEIVVESHDRSGFAFWPLGIPADANDVNDLWNELTPGAYKYDGTPKDDAVILYITQNTKDTIELEITGANENPCVGLQEILEGFKKGKDTRPLIVRLIGQITDLDYMDKGDIVIENKNNTSSFITFEGVGNDATVDGWGLRLKNATNIEVRNLGFMNCNSNEGDDLGLQQNNEHIWIHHCDFFYGEPGGDSDQAKGDGALDCKRSTYVTISYNHFWDTGKSNLLGLGEDTTEGLFITYHHNWYDHSDSRHPRVRFYSAHVYNNYYDGIAKYGVGATEGSSVFVEANVFRNCKYPMLTSMQGSDVYDSSNGRNDYSDMPTFSKENGGCIKAFNNIMTGQRRFVAYGDTRYPNPTVDYDAYVAIDRDETLDSSIRSYRGNNPYNNFDTDPDILMDYAVDSPAEARDKVVLYAGRVNGGDFVWTFNNAIDDNDYNVNENLAEKLSNYQTSLVSIQGETIPDSNESNGSDDVITGDLVHNFTTSGLDSDFFNISGNLSDSKGTVTYASLTLTQCLKIESSTRISFTIAEESELTLVFNEYFSKRIKIDDTQYNASAGILTLTLAAGTHEITKADVTNLYFIGLETL